MKICIMVFYMFTQGEIKKNQCKKLPTKAVVEKFSALLAFLNTFYARHAKCLATPTLGPNPVPHLPLMQGGEELLQ